MISNFFKKKTHTLVLGITKPASLLGQLRRMDPLQYVLHHGLWQIAKKSVPHPFFFIEIV